MGWFSPNHDIGRAGGFRSRNKPLGKDLNRFILVLHIQNQHLWWRHIPFKKEFQDKLEAIRESGYVVSEFKEIATYSEIKITNRSGTYQVRIGFVPSIEKERESIAETITQYMEKHAWEKD